MLRPYIRLNEMLSRFSDTEELVHFIRDSELPLRGQYTADYTVRNYGSVPQDIPMEYIFNSIINVKKSRIDANQDYSDYQEITNNSCYTDVEALRTAFEKAVDRYYGRVKVGAPVKYDWKFIAAVTLKIAINWHGSQNKFFEHLREILSNEHEMEPPGLSTLKKNEKLRAIFKRTRSGS